MPRDNSRKRRSEEKEKRKKRSNAPDDTSSETSYDSSDDSSYDSEARQGKSGRDRRGRRDRSSRSRSRSRSTGDKRRADPRQQRRNGQAGRDNMGQWDYGICECCGDCNSCMESWCCTFCQMSRQYNMTQSNDASINWPICLSLCCLGPCTMYMLPLIIGTMVRGCVRDRYFIVGNCCSDCCCTCCCPYCVLQQSLLQLTHNGDFPGATCYSVRDDQMV